MNSKLIGLSCLLMLLFAIRSVAAADACPVTPIALVPGVTKTIVDTTAGKANDFQDSCGDFPNGQAAPDAVFAFTTPADGTLRFRVESAPLGEDTAGILEPALYLRTNCAESFACFDLFDGHESFGGHFEAGTYYAIVDGSRGSSGRFVLTARFTAPSCGDGVPNPGEGCDVGAAASGDGCGDPGTPNACQIEAAGAGDACPGEALALGAGTTILAGTTLGYADDLASPGGYAVGGRDHVYQVTPAISGILSVAIGLGADGETDLCGQEPSQGECWDRVLYVRTSCTDASFGGELAFSDQGAMDVEHITVQVTAGVPVTLVVDGYDEDWYGEGPYHLRLDLEPAPLPSFTELAADVGRAILAWLGGT